MSFEGTWMINGYFRLTLAPPLFAVGDTRLAVAPDGTGGYRVTITGLPSVLDCQSVVVPAQVVDDALQSDVFRLPCSALPALDVSFVMAEPAASNTGGLLSAALAVGDDGRFAQDEEPVATWTAEEEGGAALR